MTTKQCARFSYATRVHATSGLIADSTKIPVDDAGRFRVDGLIPGTYGAGASAPRKWNGRIVDIGVGTAFSDIAVQPGENKELGDIILKSWL